MWIDTSQYSTFRRLRAGAYALAGDANGQWHGPFATISEPRAAKLRHADATCRVCKVCQPYGRLVDELVLSPECDVVPLADAAEHVPAHTAHTRFANARHTYRSDWSGFTAGCEAQNCVHRWMCFADRGYPTSECANFNTLRQVDQVACHRWGRGQETGEILR